MAGADPMQNEDKSGEDQVDPWAAAFAALEQVDAQGAEADAGAPRSDGEPDTDQADAGADAADAQAGDLPGDQGEPGDAGAELGGDGLQDGDAGEDVLGVTEEDVRSYRESVEQSVRDRAIDEVAAAFIKKGIRNTNGKLGASLEDTDICKRDSDGVPRFYNPETGREFTGDNPRRQAQEWVDDYNRELAEAFNKTCEQYSAKLMEEEAPALAVLEFAPTYEKLDPIRKGMLDSLLEDYEVRDKDGDVVGYSCDLQSALAAVNRQVAMIQQYSKSTQPHQPQEQQASGPALDMKSSASQTTGRSNPPKSLAEAMEAQQDALLAKMRGGR